MDNWGITFLVVIYFGLMWFDRASLIFQASRKYFTVPRARPKPYVGIGLFILRFGLGNFIEYFLPLINIWQTIGVYVYHHLGHPTVTVACQSDSAL
jgi:hypothetical protein